VLQSPLNAQFYNLPNDYSFSLLTERTLSEKDTSIHSGIKPYIHFFSKKYIYEADSHRLFKYIKEDPALDIAFYNHLLTIKPHNQNFKLTIDPILNINLGNDYFDGSKRQTSTNSRGFIAAGYIGNDFYFETMFVENQSVFPQYLSNQVKASTVVPGQGRWKVFKVTGYDYAFSSGFVSYQPFQQLNIQFGHGKQKIGYGYRSLLLSDNSFNYPFARITQQWFKGRVQYSTIYAVLMNMVPATVKPIPNAERLWQKKPAAFQYLSVNASKCINIGFFQGMIWRAGDSLNRQHLDWQFFNPVIYTNAALYGLNNKNNILAGGDVRIKLSNRLNIYSQIMLDDLSNKNANGNGLGYQAGVNYFNALGVKNLFLQFEYNHVSENSYQNPLGIRTNQSYSHYNQNLAFTVNHGDEYLGIIDYKIKRFFVHAAYHYQAVPKNTVLLYSNQIVKAQLGFLINPAYNLNISLGYVHRNQNFSKFSSLSNETNYFYLALKTSIYNLYYDF
jgi:hypothetical protein